LRFNHSHTSSVFSYIIVETCPTSKGIAIFYHELHHSKEACRNLPYFKRDCDSQGASSIQLSMGVCRNLPYFKRDCDIKITPFLSFSYHTCRNLPYFKRDCDPLAETQARGHHTV